MANAVNCNLVADAIEGHTIPDLGFNMAWFYARSGTNYPDNSGHRCRTVACVAGWAYSVEHGNKKAKSARRAEKNASHEAQDFLGLNSESAFDLFYAPSRTAAARAQITPAQAVRVLRHLAETGEVRWDLATQDEAA